MQFHRVQLEYLLLCLSKVLKRDELELFCVVLWLVWKHRNVVVHGDQSRSPEAILEDAALWLMEYQVYIKTANRAGQLNPQQVVMVGFLRMVHALN